MGVRSTVQNIYLSLQQQNNNILKKKLFNT